MPLTTEQFNQYDKSLTDAINEPDFHRVNEIVADLFENKYFFRDQSFIKRICDFYQKNGHQTQLIIFLAALKRFGMGHESIDGMITLSEKFLNAALRETPDDFLYIIEDNFLASAQLVYDVILKNYESLSENMALKKTILYLLQKGICITGSKNLKDNKDNSFDFAGTFKAISFPQWLPILALHVQLLRGSTTIPFVGFFNNCVIETYLFDELLQDITLLRSEISQRMMKLRQNIGTDPDYTKRKDKVLYLLDRYAELIPVYTYQFELPYPVQAYAKKANKNRPISHSLAALLKAFYVEGGISEYMSAYFSNHLSTPASTEKIEQRTELDSRVKNSLEAFISDEFRPYAFASIQQAYETDKTLPTLSAIILHEDLNLRPDFKNALCYFVDRLTHPEYKDHRDQIIMTDLNENTQAPVFSTAPAATLFSIAAKDPNSNLSPSAQAALKRARFMAGNS